MNYISENHGLNDKELADFRFHCDLKRFPYVLVHGYNPIFEGKWILPCATGGECHSIGLINLGFKADDVEIRSYRYNYRFVFRPVTESKRQWPGADLNYEACTGCNRPMKLYDSLRLNKLLGYIEPKRVVKKMNLEGLDDFW